MNLGTAKKYNFTSCEFITLLFSRCKWFRYNILPESPSNVKFSGFEIEIGGQQKIENFLCIEENLCLTNSFQMKH